MVVDDTTCIIEAKEGKVFRESLIANIINDKVAAVAIKTEKILNG